MGEQAIRKAVIPAAGLGTRFLPLTKAQPKEMLPVVDKPVIQYVVEESIQSGIDDILIITGRNKRAIEDHFDHSLEIEWKLKQKNSEDLANFRDLSNLVDIHYIRQKEPKGLGNAILYAEKHCDGEPFALLLGDTITIPDHNKETCTRQMIDIFEKYNKSVIGVEPVPDEKIQDYGIIDGLQIGSGIYQIRDLVEKPKLEDAPSNLGAIGRYILTPDIFELIKEVGSGYGGEVQLTDALRRLDKPIGFVTDCRRFDIGDKIGWMKSNIELALEREEFSEELKIFIKDLLK